MADQKPSVFVLSYGCYSDETIFGIFSTRKAAEDVVAKSDGSYEWNEVIEYTLDEQVGSLCVNGYHVAIDLVTGETWRQFETREFFPNGSPLVSLREPGVFVTSPESWEHAIKIAVEHRQKWLRENPSAVEKVDSDA